ncbi:MAG TPA: murein L,D-transpeptidase catalytic domain family protein [Candidatus Binatia bacterium]|nr:murein L,D-transpeptidase catalytic domain family protein [Candidatus Binatia bacterium]
MSARSAAARALLVCLLSACATAPPPRPLPPPPPPQVTDTSWPRREVLDLAMQAYQCGEREGRFDRPVLTVIDYSLPSREPRLWVIDVERRQMLYHELVAHGEGSGDTMAVAFSNRVGSHQSSLGLFRTEGVYTGQYGYSLRLSGLEPGVNDKARERAIVVHGFPDISRWFAAQRGTIARTWGCPAVPVEVAPQLIDSIAGGSALFAYYPDADWLRESHYLHCNVQLVRARLGN